MTTSYFGSARRSTNLFGQMPQISPLAQQQDEVDELCLEWTMPTNHQVISSLSRSSQTIALIIALLGLVAARSGWTQSPRISGAISDTVRSSIEGSRPARATAATDAGALPDSTTLRGMTIVFNRTAEQEASLKQLLAAQQNPASTQYHQWLTPEQFAASYGLSDADISTVSTWLQQEGFTVDGIARSKTQIRFSGTAAQVRSAFGSELHNYTSNGKTRFAPSANLNVPTALLPVVLTVRNVSSFKPQPHVIFKSKASQTKPGFTSSQSGNHYLGPKDIATIYDINPAYNAGYTGAGQSIAVLGQSEISLSDARILDHYIVCRYIHPRLRSQRGGDDHRRLQFLQHYLNADRDAHHRGGRDDNVFFAEPLGWLGTIYVLIDDFGIACHPRDIFGRLDLRDLIGKSHPDFCIHSQH